MVISICDEAKKISRMIRYERHMEGVYYHARHNLHELSGSEILQGTVGVGLSKGLNLGELCSTLTINR